jgi:hypothetical protein
MHKQRHQPEAFKYSPRSAVIKPGNTRKTKADALGRRTKKETTHCANAPD